jgi:general stress protein CsbA
LNYRPFGNASFVAAQLAMVLLVARLPGESGAGTRLPVKPTVVLDDIQVAEPIWVITVRGRDYGLRRVTGNRYRDPCMEIVLAGSSIKIPHVPSPIVIVFGAVSMGVLCFVWVHIVRRGRSREGKPPGH